MTPIQFARGKWELLDPWLTALVSDASYVCNSIRSFQSVLNEGVDIFKIYYEPRGLTREVYDTHRVNSASLVLLYSVDHPEVIVPTPYIKTAPTTVSTGFSRVVIGAEIGVVPDGLALDYLTSEIKGLISALTGLTDSEVTLYTAPITGFMTPEQAAMFESNRLAAVENRSTFYAKVESLQNQLNAMTAIKDRYEQIIIQAGLVSK